MKLASWTRGLTSSSIVPGTQRVSGTAWPRAVWCIVAEARSNPKKVAGPHRLPWCISRYRPLSQCGHLPADPVLVRDSLVIVMCGRNPLISLRDSGTRALFDNEADLAGGGSETIVAYISDFQNGRMPGGTAVVITNDNCRVAGVSSFTIPDTNAPGFTEFAITLTPDDTLGETGTVTLTVTAPDEVGGNINSATFTCID